MRKQKQGSIIVTVLILMVVSSFLVLLTMRYVLSMLAGFTSLTEYYKAYYLARGGMDVLLTQHSYRGWGYETSIESNANAFTCGGLCGVAGSIQSRFPRIDTSKAPLDPGCTKETAIVLLPGQSSIHALFADSFALPTYFQPLQSLVDYQSFSSLKDVDMYVYGEPTAGKLYRYDSRDGVFGKTNEFDTIPTFPKVPNTNGDLLKKNILGGIPNRVGIFLIVHNPRSTTVGSTSFSYCLSAPKKNIIGQTSIIRSRAFVNKSDVTLETIKTNRFPSILVQ